VQYPVQTAPYESEQTAESACHFLERFRNYCGLIKVARSGFPWEKTTKGDVASVYTNCETALDPAASAPINICA
jgi:hypothetical protein